MWTKPKPCPFCGIRPDASTFYDKSLRCWNAIVECTACDVEMYASAKKQELARQRVLGKWNRRAK